MDSNRLSQMISQTLFAVDKERTSTVLTGVRFVVEDGVVTLAATDGKVLSEARCSDGDFSGTVLQEGIIPAGTFSHIKRLLSGDDGHKVELSVFKNIISLRASIAQHVRFELSSRMVEGVYPSYQSALEKPHANTLTFDSAKLSKAVRRTALMTTSQSRGIVFAIENGKAELKNLNETCGSARIELSCDYTGGAVRFGLNANYVAEILKAHVGTSCTFLWSGPGKGLILKSEHASFLIMPITLPD